jgi:hypothetical protein
MPLPSSGSKNKSSVKAGGKLAICLRIRFLLRFLFGPKNGGDRFLRKFGLSFNGLHGVIFQELDWWFKVWSVHYLNHGFNMCIIICNWLPGISITWSTASAAMTSHPGDTRTNTGSLRTVVLFKREIPNENGRRNRQNNNVRYPLDRRQASWGRSH